MMAKNEPQTSPTSDESARNALIERLDECLAEVAEQCSVLKGLSREKAHLSASERDRLVAAYDGILRWVEWLNRLDVLQPGLW